MRTTSSRPELPGTCRDHRRPRQSRDPLVVGGTGADQPRRGTRHQRSGRARRSRHLVVRTRLAPRHERIVAAIPVAAWLQQLAAQTRTIPVSPAIAATAVGLPSSFPGDPADRLICATAGEKGWPLITKDHGSAIIAIPNRLPSGRRQAAARVKEAAGSAPRPDDAASANGWTGPPPPSRSSQPATVSVQPESTRSSTGAPDPTGWPPNRQASASDAHWRAGERR